jgi:L-seryl-tRNA(Ser) seleniumtransferase
LAALGRERGIPVYEDLGSGCLVDLSPWGVREPSPQASLRAGVGLVSFSGDKLLGGPQAGILAGRPELVARLRRNPMFRAMRVDKMTVAVMETALRALLLERWPDLPVMRMICQTPEELRRRASAFVESYAFPDAALVAGESMLGGGSTPQQTLATTLIAFDRDAVALERALRGSEPPVVARIDEDRLLIDLRTVHPSEEPALAAALRAALPAAHPG